MDAADLAFAGLARQAELVRDGEVSSRELTELYLERIGRLDPQLRGYRVVLADEALAAADEADRRRGDDAPPLNGVPIAIKDDTDIAGQVTAHGSLAHGGPAAQDAEVVRRLRAAGAVLLGKTHVPELEALAVTESLAFGATRNPWDPARTPGGSSGGSAAAVAAGLAAAALGDRRRRLDPHPRRVLRAVRPQAAARPRPDASELARHVGDRRAHARRARHRAVPRRRQGAPRPRVRRAPPRDRRARCGSRTRWRCRAGRRRGSATSSAARWSARPSGCASSGHTVVERDPDYGNAAVNVVTRYLDGDQRPTRPGCRIPSGSRAGRAGSPRMGARIPRFLVERAHAQEAADRERVGAVFADFDVLMTPASHAPAAAGRRVARPARAGDAQRHGELRRRTWRSGTTPASPPRRCRSRRRPTGFPVAVQLVGRPGDEATLLSLSAQLETATGWPERRPPLAA